MKTIARHRPDFSKQWSHLSSGFSGDRMLIGVRAPPHTGALFFVFAALVFAGNLQAQGSIAYTKFDGNNKPVLYVMNPDGSGDTRITTGVDDPGPLSPVWSKNGTLLAVTSKKPAFAVSQNVFLFNPTDGTAPQVTTFSDQVFGTGQYTVVQDKALSPDGLRMAVSCYQSITGTGASSGYPMVKVFRTDNTPSIVEVYATGSNGNALLHTGEGIDWSPKEDLLVWPAEEQEYNSWTGLQFPVGALVLLRPVTGGQPTRLTHPAWDNRIVNGMVANWIQTDYQPTFSPDGEKIAYVRSEVIIAGGRPDFLTPSIRIINVDGTNDRLVATFQKRDYLGHLSWSPDGTRILFEKGTQSESPSFPGWPLDGSLPSTRALHVIKTDGTGLTLVKAAPAFGADWNPKGLVYSAAPTIASIMPTRADVGAANQILTVNGSNYTTRSAVLWNGSVLATTYVSPTKLTAVIPASKLVTSGIATVRSYNPAPGGGLSPGLTFTISTPPAVPQGQYPADNVFSLPSQVTLQSAAFSDPDGGTHLASHWQVFAGNNTVPFFDSNEVSGDRLTRLTISGLTPGTTYRWKVRYKDQLGVWSAFSALRSFTTYAPGDFNANGRTDVLWQHSTSGQISIWYMDGRARVGGAVFPVQPAAGWKLVNTGDFNTDMKPDLVLQNAASGDVVLWYMNGLSLLSQGPLNIQMGSKLWCAAAVGDMNKDGMLDLLYQNRSTGNVQVRYLNRTRQVTGSGVFPQQLSPVFRLCGTGDVNGDGNPDAVWQNRNTGAVMATYLNGLTIVAGGGGLSVQPSFSWQVAGLEDHNGDGKADLLLQHQSTGQTLVWFLNGRTVLAGGGATSVQQTSHLFQARNSRSLFAPPPNGFSFIPAGTFQMGNALSASGDGLPSELPLHGVTVGAYHMAKYEVTKALWDQVRTWGLANGYTDLPAGSGKAPGHPVQGISWYAMIKWCNARSQKEGLAPCYMVGGLAYKTGNSTPTCNWTANGYRLPTEAEWERAARGGVAGKRFPWGDTISHAQANYFSSALHAYDVSPTRDYHPAYHTVGVPYSAPSGSFAANAYGLCEITGNVWEWCWDWYGNYPATAQSNPTGPATGTYRSIRGGAWSTYANGCRLSHRYYDLPVNTNNTIGFRVVRRVEP